LNSYTAIHRAKTENEIRLIFLRYYVISNAFLVRVQTSLITCGVVICYVSIYV